VGTGNFFDAETDEELDLKEFIICYYGEKKISPFIGDITGREIRLFIYECEIS
jgi:hypothetical protein